MPRKKSPSKISASAKVEATAKAVYQRKKTISEEIPPDVTRAKAGALLDLISPFTHWFGLKGDKLQFKRAQFELEQQVVLAKIASQAKRKIEAMQGTIKPVPNKFIVPFLQQASLEDPDSELVDMWASLLASAATEDSSHHVHFVSIISQLSAKQGDILRHMINTNNVRDLQNSMEKLIYQSVQDSRIRETIQKDMRDLGDIDAVDQAIENLFDGPGIVFVHAAVENKNNKDYFDIDVETIYRDEDEVDYSILEAAGLVRRVQTDFVDAGNWSILSSYYHLTWLGFYFAKACGLVGPYEAEVARGSTTSR